jgi:cytochrome c
MAAFVRENMPQNNPGRLTAPQAHDVVAYVHG